MEFVRIGIVDDHHGDRAGLLPWEIPAVPPKAPAQPPRMWLQTFDSRKRDDGRLIAEFCREAHKKSAPNLLAQAAVKWLENPRYSRVYADLAVTGRAAKASFDRAGPGDVVAELARLRIQVPEQDRRISEIFQHARDLIAYLRASEPERATLPIGKDGTKTRWIAVCAEDDAPWRPVNVGCTEHEQIDVPVQLSDRHRSAEMTTRAVVVGDASACDRWILYLHGGGSRAEECEGVAKALRALRGGERTVVVSPDLPGCGYSERIPPAVFGLDPTKKLRKNAEEKGPFPFLEMLDDFVECFVAAVPEVLPGLSDKPLAAVCGGSLGGNLALRVAWRARPEAEKHVAWSPASVWDPLDDPIGLKNMGPEEAWKLAAQDELVHRKDDVDENNDTRRRFFWQTYERKPPLIPRTAEMWWDEHWPPRGQFIQASRHDRVEVYGEVHRRYAWRYSYEQLFFSWQVEERGRRRRQAIERPVVLLAGTGDNFHFAHIFDRVKATGLGREPMPGAERVVLLGRTGHSIHDERPSLLAREIHAALNS